MRADERGAMLVALDDHAEARELLALITDVARGARPMPEDAPPNSLLAWLVRDLRANVDRASLDAGAEALRERPDDLETIRLVEGFAARLAETVRRDRAADDEPYEPPGYL